MRCIEGGREIGENLKFCKYCGAPVKAASLNIVDDTIKCKACGAPLKQGVAFCTQCGTPVNGDSAASVKPDVSKKEKSSKGKSGGVGKILIAVLTIVSILLVGFLAYYFLGKSGILGKHAEPASTVSTRNDSTEVDSSSVETNTETESESETEKEKESISKTDTNTDASNINDIAAEILNERDNIVRAITSGSYSSMKAENDITVYTNSNALVSISAGKSFKNDDYSRSFYYVDGQLAFAEYAGTDLQQFYFENGDLIRWRYAQNISDSKKAVNYDMENTTAYIQWEQTVLADSNELISIWENASQIDDNSEDYILPRSDTRYISESELSGLTREEVRTAVNELYARHGRRFNEASWQAYFDSKSWYVPMVDPDDFSESVFNNYELENKKTLVRWEEDHGWR